MPLEGGESNNLDKQTYERGCETLAKNSSNLYELCLEGTVLLQLPGLLDVVERVRAPEGGERTHIALSSFGSQSLIERRHCKTTECSMSLHISRVLHREDFEEGNTTHA